MKLRVRIGANPFSDLAICSHRNCALADHNRVRLQKRGHVFGSGTHVLEICSTGFVLRSSDADEDAGGLADGVFVAGCKLQSAGSRIAFYQFFQAGLVDRNAAIIQQINFAHINVKARHIVAAFSEARAGHQTHIASTNHRDLHECLERPNEFVSCLNEQDLKHDTLAPANREAFPGDPHCLEYRPFEFLRVLMEK